jgi:hypothetical protein
MPAGRRKTKARQVSPKVETAIKSFRYLVAIGLIIGSRIKSLEIFQLIGSFLIFSMFFLSGSLSSSPRISLCISTLPCPSTRGLCR